MSQNWYGWAKYQWKTQLLFSAMASKFLQVVGILIRYFQKKHSWKARDGCRYYNKISIILFLELELDERHCTLNLFDFWKNHPIPYFFQCILETQLVGRVHSFLLCSEQILLYHKLQTILLNSSHKGHSQLETLSTLESCWWYHIPINHLH